MRREKSKKSLSEYQKYRRLLYWNTGLAIFCFIYTVIVFAVLLSLPFPQRTRIEYMDIQMKNEGEAAFIILATTWVFTCLPTYLVLLITCGILIYRYFFVMKKRFDKSFGNTWWSKILIIIYCIFYLLLPVFFVWPLYKKPDSEPGKSFSNVNIKTGGKGKGFWVSVSSFLTLLVSMILPVTLLSFFFPNMANVKSRPQDLKEAYTISEKKPNTMVLYFDRGYGLVFNELLMVDYIMYHSASKSMIDMFPELTSYLNCLSQSMVTNTSNPSINGSWYMQAGFKNMHVKDPFRGTYNNQDTYDQFYMNSYESDLGMLASHGYKNFSLLNIPYYGMKTTELNAQAYKFQNDINNLIQTNQFFPSNYTGDRYKDLKVTSLDVTEIVKTLGLSPKRSKLDEIRFEQYFASSANSDDSYVNPLNNAQYSYGSNKKLNLPSNNDYFNLRTSATKDSTFIQLYFQNTHEDYSYVKNDSMVTKYNPGGINEANVDDGKAIYTDPTPNNLVVANWYAIQKIKRVLTYMKKLPASDPARPWVKNQYDNTNIYIISDHGTPIVNKKENLINVNNYLIKNGAMTQAQSDYFLNRYFQNPEMSFGFWNCIFLRKPAKYKNTAWNVMNDTPDKFFNQEDLYVTSDLMPIIEADVLKQQIDATSTRLTPKAPYVMDPSQSWYYDDTIKGFKRFHPDNKHDAALIETDFNQNFLFDPINDPKFKIGKRNIPLYRTNWLFFGFLKKFDIYGKFYFVNKYPGGVYNINNFMTEDEFYSANGTFKN